MNEMRIALGSDVIRLKEIWKRCFGDSDSFIDFYFTQRFKPQHTAVYLQEGVITAMLTMIPVQWVEGVEDEKSIKGSMLYAIATHPDYQHRGIARTLMNWAESYLRDHHQVDLMVLVPAEAHLFSFYEKLGYQEGFTLCETVLKVDEIKTLPERAEIHSSGRGGEVSCEIVTATPPVYNRIRDYLLRGTAYIAYGEAEIVYQKKVSQLSGADLYQFNIGGVQGCAALERLNKDQVLVKELLLPEQFIFSGLKALVESVDAQEFIVRLPADWGKALGGQVRPFGMLRWTQQRKESREIPPKERRSIGETGYLGLAFD